MAFAFYISFSMRFYSSRVLGTSILAGTAARAAKFDGPDYESLPLDTIFPGTWENNIRAPFNKSYITPVKIFNFEGAVSGAEAVLQDTKTEGGISWVIGPGGLITFEFGENIAGKYVWQMPRDKRCANSHSGFVSKSTKSRTTRISSSHTPNLPSS